MPPTVACIGGASLDRKFEPLGELRPATSNPVRSTSSSGGTARNIAEALARLGCSVGFFSQVGSDANGDRLLDELSELGVSTAGVGRSRSLPTATYTAVLDSAGELVLGLADMEVLDSLGNEWAGRHVQELRGYDLWIVDTNLPTTVVEELVLHLPGSARLYVDPVSVEKSRRIKTVMNRIDTIFPDRAEALALADLDSGTDWGDVATRLRKLGVASAIVTLGSDGVFVSNDRQHEKVAAMRPDPVSDVTGAGDSFVAGYVFGESQGSRDPVRHGLAAATLAIESSATVSSDLTVENLLARVEALS